MAFDFSSLDPSKFFNQVGDWFSGAAGGRTASQYTPYQNVTTPTIDNAALQAQINANAGLQKQQNVNSYNAALASQAGVNPALAANLIGNNLAGTNQQIAGNTQNLLAQNQFQTALANQQAQLQTNQLNSANYNAAMTGNQQAQEAAANRGQGVLGGIIGGIGGIAESVFSSDERMKESPNTSSFQDWNQMFHSGFVGTSPTQFNPRGDFVRESQNSGGFGVVGKVLGKALGNYLKSDSTPEPTGEAFTAETRELAPNTTNYLDDITKQLNPGYMGYDMQVPYSYPMMSDRRSKEPMELSEHNSTIQRFLDTLQPYEYKYKPNTVAYDGGQKHMGIMAQDLEKTDVGDNAVMDTQYGKMVDVKQLSALIAAGLGNVHERLKKLESTEAKEHS